MTDRVNIREIAVEVLMEILERGSYSHLVMRNVLEKYAYLEKKDRAFLSKVVDGTIERLITIDYTLDQFSSIKVNKMKPFIRNLLRCSLYQMMYLDTVPDSAICNEAVKLAQKKGFHNLKGFINGMLRNIARKKECLPFPKREDNELKYLSIRYSMPEWVIHDWINDFGTEITEKMCQSFFHVKRTVIRCNLQKTTAAELKIVLEQQGILVETVSNLDYVLQISGYDHIKGLKEFQEGHFQVQDLSSIFTGEIASPQEGTKILDLCAAPGGKSLHVAEKLNGTGWVTARDLTENKRNMIQDNIDRMGYKNIEAVLGDALVFEEQWKEQADIVIADLPCSGLGVIGRKPDIRYRMTKQKQEELIILQRKILENAAEYVKDGGILLYSTCTINKDENIGNVKWILENFPFETVPFDVSINQELDCKTAAEGYQQFLPGIHKTDGFFIAKMKKCLGKQNREEE